MEVVPVKKPVTAKQWLAQSLGWTVVSLMGCALVMNCLWYEHSDGLLWLILGFGSAFSAHLLIWWKAVDSSWWRQDAGLNELWAFGIAKLWLMILMVFQVSCLFLLLSVLGLFFGENEGASWGSPKT